MEILIRTIAIIIEVVLLVAITYAILNGVRLSAFDLGIGQKYGKAIAMMLIAVGFILVIFFIAHLITFYPAI